MRDENYNSKQPFIAASADPTPELLLASLIICELLESLMNAPQVRMKSLVLSGTYNNLVRQIGVVVRK
jgi:hypothetical protein